MKYFTKEALFGFGKKQEQVPASPKPFRTYEQNVESLPTYALKKRLTRLQGQAGAMGEGTMTDKTLSAYKTRVDPIINELRSRGEL